jgi:hypothetical protein
MSWAYVLWWAQLIGARTYEKAARKGVQNPFSSGRNGVLVASLLLLIATPTFGNPSEPPEPRADSGVDFTGAHSSDDGIVQRADTADVGETGPVYGAWGAASSVDPATEGLDAFRHDKDIARCTAAVGNPEAGFLDVEVANA